MLAKNVHMLITASKTAKAWGNERHLSSKCDPACAHAVGKTSICAPYICIDIWLTMYVRK